MAAIDAPEKRQPFGNRARQALSELCFQTQAEIRSTATDRYRRTVAEVKCRGQDVAEHMVAGGWAWYYVSYGKGYEHLAQAEASARSNRRGLWADAQPMAPWEWRRLNVRRRD